MPSNTARIAKNTLALYFRQTLIMLVSFIFITGCPGNVNTFENGFFIKASSQAPDSIYIEWETGVQKESYQIFRQSSDSDECEYLATVNNGNSYLDEGLKPSTRYNYKIAYLDNENTEQYIGDSFFAVTQPHLIAHRGFWSFDGIPENSIASLQAAAELGVYGSEFDVHLTADNVPVVYHDYTIKDTDIIIQQVTYSIIKEIVLPNGERIPTLDDYLEAGKKLPIRLILEIKPHATQTRDMEAVQIVVDRVKHFDLENRVEYISFNISICKELSLLQPHNYVGYLRGDKTPTELMEYGFSTLSYSFDVIQSHPEYINEAKELGLISSVWVVNDLSLIESMVNLGVKFITTDISLQAKEYLTQKVYQYNFMDVL